MYNGQSKKVIIFVYLGLFISNSNQSSSSLIAQLSHCFFYVDTATTDMFYHVVERDFLFPVCRELCPVLSAILFQLFPVHKHL